MTKIRKKQSRERVTRRVGTARYEQNGEVAQSEEREGIKTAHHPPPGISPLIS